MRQFSQYHQSYLHVRSAPCSKDEAAATAKVGRREALALVKIEGPAGSVVDAAGAAGLVLK